jgi:ribosomal protein S18 acetylase RimI-like enzyme
VGSETTELERAVAFEEALRERCAERLVPFRFGTALFHDTLARVWELNLLRVDRPEGATVDALVAEAERLHAGAGHSHRRLAFHRDDAGSTLAPAFAALGWTVDRFLFMAYRGGGRRIETGAVSEVDSRAIRPLREQIVRAEPWAQDDEVVRQVLDAGELVARAGSARSFAVVVEGRVASCADLYSDGRVAQVEDVATLPEERGRGHASAVVVRAVEEAVRERHELVFLVADEDDWPKELYAKLGFTELGRKWTFLRPSVE